METERGFGGVREKVVDFFEEREEGEVDFGGVSHSEIFACIIVGFVAFSV